MANVSLINGHIDNEETSKITKEIRSKKISKMIELRNEGKTYAEIAKIMGTSKQRVHYLIGGKSDKFFRIVSCERCIWCGLREWMNENKVCVAELTRRLYGHGNPSQQSLVRDRLAGKVNFQKDFIDNILRITGLTYEEAFKLDK